MTHEIVRRICVYVAFVPLLVLLVACSGDSEPRLEQWKDGAYQVTAVSTYKFSGKRDGNTTLALAELTLTSGAQLRIELEVVYDPEPVLSFARWTLDGDQAGSGEAFAESLRFLGGQGEGPSLGGRLRLDENGNPRFRVVLPIRPVGQQQWTAE